MRNRKSNGLPIPYGEQLGHPQDCGCGCQLTPQQWQAEYENQLALTDLHPNGCTHCGGPERGHGQLWLRSTGWHNWEAPSDAQRLFRMKQRRAARHIRSGRADGMFCMFCWGDDCGGGCYG